MRWIWKWIADLWRQPKELQERQERQARELARLRLELMRREGNHQGGI